jgi:SAM-dependent methyltransferase
MQAYGPAFARAYQLRWGGFARQVTPRLIDFYAHTAAGQARRPVLDLCCGTGLAAQGFVEAGYQVTGLDLSPHMLAYARQNTAAHIGWHARFVRADAARFALAGHFGLAVALYDALNHLPDLAALRSCFRCTADAVAPGGVFIFDLNTRLGLRHWNVTSVDDSPQALVITRSSFDGSGERAVLNVTGFLRRDDGAFERFDEAVYNTIFEIQTVLWTLLDVGWVSAYAARLGDLHTPLAAPEQEGRVFVVARR